MDKRTGEIVWVSNPGGRPYDTAYAGTEYRDHQRPAPADHAAWATAAFTP